MVSENTSGRKKGIKKKGVYERSAFEETRLTRKKEGAVYFRRAGQAKRERWPIVEKNFLAGEEGKNRRKEKRQKEVRGAGGCKGEKARVPRTLSLLGGGGRKKRNLIADKKPTVGENSIIRQHRRRRKKPGDRLLKRKNPVG